LIFSASSSSRFTVPRWYSKRHLRKFLDSRTDEELPKSHLQDRAESRQQQLREVWIEQRDLPAAIELLLSSLTKSNQSEERAAAEFVLSHSHHESLRFICLGVLEQNEPGLPVFEHHGQSSIRHLRELLRLNDRDPIAWLELARHYLITGQSKKASRCIAVAQRFGIRDPFICRALARYYLHCNDVSRALFVLRDQKQITNNPWLLCATGVMVDTLDRRVG